MNQFKVSIGHSKSKPIIIVYYNHKRHRYWNGKVINVNVKSIENSKKISDSIITLPSSVNLKDKEINYICNLILNYKLIK